MEAANARLSVAVPAALLLIFILLYFTFSSAKYALLIFTAIPLSAIGGVFALALRGMPFSISAGVGFIALFGVAVLNGIVLISEFNRLKKQGNNDVVDIVKLGTSIRLRPVIMTALVASLGFLPMALSNSSGAEVQKPLATVVIGGLLTATLLTLIVLPLFYILIEKYQFKTAFNKKALLLVTLMCSVFFTQAQTKIYTLKAAIETAINNNKSLVANSYQVDLAEIQTRHPTQIPKTEVGLLYGQNNSIAKNDNHISVVQKLHFPTAFFADKKLADSHLQSSKKMMSVKTNELSYQVVLAYRHLQYLYAYQALLKQQDSILTGFKKAANLKYQYGESANLESVTANTQYENLQNSTLQVKTEIEVQQSKLGLLLGLSEPIEIAEKDLKAEEFLLIKDSSFVQQNPTFNYLQQKINVLDAQQKSEVAKALPDITLGYFNQSLIGNQNINGTEVYFDGTKRFQGFQLGLSVPLFFGSYQTKIKSIKVEKNIAETESTYYEMQINAEFKQLHQQYLQQKKALLFYQQSALPNAYLIEKTSKLAYTNGQIDYQEYLLSLKNANEIKVNYLSAINSLNNTVAQLSFLVGDLK